MDNQKILLFLIIAILSIQLVLAQEIPIQQQDVSADYYKSILAIFLWVVSLIIGIILFIKSKETPSFFLKVGILLPLGLILSFALSFIVGGGFFVGYALTFFGLWIAPIVVFIALISSIIAWFKLEKKSLTTIVVIINIIYLILTILMSIDIKNFSM